MLDTYGNTPIRTTTSRGYHLWYSAPTNAVTWDRSAPEEGVDIKIGPNQHVVGHGCVRSDGGKHVLQAEAFLIADIAVIKPAALREAADAEIRDASDKNRISRNSAGQVRKGSRHRYLVRCGKDMVLHVAEPNELYQNLLYEPDACEDPAPFTDEEVFMHC